MRLIDADALELHVRSLSTSLLNEWDTLGVLMAVGKQPTIDAVPVEKYNELHEAFVDFVCSGVTNPAPYCKNRCEECVNCYGWCRQGLDACRGFNPDKEDE